MLRISYVLRSILILTLFSGAESRVTSSEEPTLSYQTLEAIQDCMSRSPAPWPDEWKLEYLETIRRAVELNRNASHYVVRLEILRKGFGPYWESFQKTPERSLFDVHHTRIRWYTEYLMGSEFPADQERQKLRDQYKDLWDHAASSLLAQFPFLDPNTVEKAKANGLGECYRKIEAPLMPVYLRPFSEEQVRKIKQRWDEMRYIRVDLCRQLDHGSSMSAEKSDAPLANAKRDYALAKKALSQLLGQVWMIASQRPDYYLIALENQTKALKSRYQSIRQARSYQQRLEKTHSRQLLQAEHLSFLLAALLETPRRLKGIQSITKQEQSLLEIQDKTAKGVDAYEVDNFSHQK